MTVLTSPVWLKKEKKINYIVSPTIIIMYSVVLFVIWTCACKLTNKDLETIGQEFSRPSVQSGFGMTSLFVPLDEKLMHNKWATTVQKSTYNDDGGTISLVILLATLPWLW